MIEELRLDGVYLPAALGWALLALLLTLLVRQLTRRWALRRWLWQPELLELACFFCFWWGIAVLADALLPDGMLS